MRLIDADLLGLTDMEIIMCDGDYKEALIMLIDKIAHAPTIEPEQKWIPFKSRPLTEEEKEEHPECNCSLPIIGQWRVDNDGAGCWYLGDTDETFLSEGLYVDGWWELPTKPEVKP